MIISVVVLVVGAGFGVWFGFVRAASTSGAVLAWVEGRGLVSEHTDGTHPTVFENIGSVGGGGGTVGPDGSVLVTDAGDIVRLRAGKPVSHSTALYAAISEVSPDASVNSRGPFADHDADVLFSGPLSSEGTGHVYAVESTGGAPHDLGVAGDYSGDPQQDAVFAGVPVGGAAPADSGLADSGIEHRVVAARPAGRHRARSGAGGRPGR